MANTIVGQNVIRTKEAILNIDITAVLEKFVHISGYFFPLLSELHELLHANLLAEVPGIQIASLWAYHRFRRYAT